MDKSDIKVYLDHNKEKGILARSKFGNGSLSYEIDERGVIYSFQAPNTNLGNEVVEGLNRGDYNESSFAFTVEKDSWTKKEDGTYLRCIEKINQIYDFSIVADAAYSDTYVSIAKRSLEEFKASETVIPKGEDKNLNTGDNEVKETSEERNNNTIKTKKTMENFSLLKTINDVTNNRQINERA